MLLRRLPIDLPADFLDDRAQRGHLEMLALQPVDDGDAPEDARRHLLRLWLDAPVQPVHPYIRCRGIQTVAGRTPSFDWRSITAVRH